ncbi:MAG: uroporphyrinogen-III synthase [Alphaproteobacteria bacterium]|nr:uroporphyrinogen-III synthase [Alphaproteobacteria bacterium]
MTPACRACRVLVTRPRDDAAGLIAALEQRGLDVLSQPMLEIDFVDDATPPDLDGRQALLFTSANGVRAFARLSGRRDLPVFAVGDATAATARRSGFAAVESAQGNVDDLAGLVQRRCDPAAGPLLHVAGSAVAGDLAGQLHDAGFTVERVQLYTARTAEALDRRVQSAIADGTIEYALFFSPRSAATFVSLTQAAEVSAACAKIKAVCLSPAVAEALSPIGWGAVIVAPAPTQEALLECLDRDIKGGGHASMTTSDSDDDLLRDGAAAAIIDRFGGIRPMAAKLDMPVTTIQGWKARGRIPANRVAALRAAAAEHNVDLTGLAAAPSSAVPDVPAEPAAADAAASEPPGEPEPAAEADDATAADETVSPPDTATGAGITDASPARAGGSSGLAWLALLIAVLAVAGLLTQRYWTPYLGGSVTGAATGTVDTAAVDGLSERVAKLESGQQKLTGLETQISTLDKRVAALPTTAAGGVDSEKLDTIAKEIGTTKQAVEGMSTRVTALEASIGKTPQAVTDALSRLQQDAVTMRQSISALSSRLKALEDRPVISGERIAALAVTAGQLESAVNAGQAYAGPLARLRALAAGDKAMADPIAALANDADTGVPTMAALTRRFDRLAPQLVASTPGDAATSWLGKVREKAVALVNLRPVGASGSASPITRAEQALADNDLATAVKALDDVTGPTDTWRTDAQRRLAADGALAKINAQVVDRLAGSANTDAASTPGRAVQ